MAVTTQEAGGNQLADRADHRLALGGVIGVIGEDAGQLALGDAGRVLGKDKLSAAR